MNELKPLSKVKYNRLKYKLENRLVCSECGSIYIIRTLWNTRKQTYDYLCMKCINIKLRVVGYHIHHMDHIIKSDSDRLTVKQLNHLIKLSLKVIKCKNGTEQVYNGYYGKIPKRLSKAP